MDSLTYPDNWDTLVLKPGESVSVTGTLKGVREGDTHTDRAIVTGTPLVECAPSNGDPFNDKTDGGEDTDPEYSTGDVTEIDGKQLCADTQVTSNTDDWNGYRAKPLASTGTAVLGLAGGALAVLLAGGSLLVFRKRHRAQGSGRHTAVNAGTGPAIAVAGLLAMAGASLLAAVARTRRHGADPDGLTAD